MLEVLIVGFQKYDQDMYPHLKCYIDGFSKYCAVKYFFFRERGYFIERIIEKPYYLKSYLSVMKALLQTIVDSIKLVARFQKVEKIIVVDHYAYAIVSFLFNKKGIVLWSHDIISPDHPIYKNMIVKFFLHYNAKTLIEKKKVIIQDDNRLELLKQSLHLENSELDVFYIPVSLEQTHVTKSRELSSGSRPRLIQIGGIGAYRFSDKLLEHYQKNPYNYRLYFHGFIFPKLLVSLKLAACNR